MITWQNNSKGPVEACVSYLGFNKSSLIDLRLSQQEGTHAWYKKPSQVTWASEIMDIGEESTTPLY